ncbi:MAG: 50S ribosomal protein L15e [Nanoarchaeota archaeon]
MSLYQYIKDSKKEPSPELNELFRGRIIEWRNDIASVRIERPTRLDKARALGYKPKQGIIIIRQRVERGGRLREKIRHARRTKHSGRRKDVDKNYQWIAEERANKKHINCEVLNSYYVAEDGNYLWYEVILVDRTHPVIVNDKSINWICEQRGRVKRGLTLA